MNCEILSTLYIRANGDIPCDDDAGERLLLANASASDWSILSTFDNSAYRHISQSLSTERLPWPSTCRSCAFYRPNQPFSESISRRELRKVQVEPSLACNLKCPCCGQSEQIRYRPKPFLMKPELFAKILRNLRRSGFAVREFEYCGQGDPLMNRDFPELVRFARRCYPDTPQRLITNGNFVYETAICGEAMEEIYVSCDGIRQQSYEQYRVGGDVGRVLTFMRAVPKQLNGQSQRLVWKYILFEFNDSDDEIREAQEAAQCLGVDMLLFVLTHSRLKSKKFTLVNTAEFPIYFPNVAINATPVHYQRLDSVLFSIKPIRERRAISLKPTVIWLGPAEHKWTGTLFNVDEVTLLEESRVFVKGWFLSKRKIDGALVRVGNVTSGMADINVPRPDVYKALPNYGEMNSGYAFTATLGGQLSGKVTVTVELLSGAKSVARFVRDYIR